MSATNSTTNYSLPIFIGTDKPAWLTDWNGAMNSIDTAIKGVSTSQEGTASSLSTLSTTVENLGTTVSGHTTSIQTLSNSVSTNTGSINTINSLIGNGTPTTTDQTIIGAINEINAQVGGTVEADDVTYDNTTSGLTATNVQSAIDEVKGLIPSSGTVDADDVSYDNTTSGLTATDVQSAIDEICDAGTTETVSVTAVQQQYATIKTFTDLPKEISAIVNVGSTSVELNLKVFSTSTNYILVPVCGAIQSDYNYLIALRLNTSTKVLDLYYEHGTNFTQTVTVTKIIYK